MTTSRGERDMYEYVSFIVPVPFVGCMLVVIVVQCIVCP